MRKTGLLIGLIWLCVPLWATKAIEIPLSMSVIQFMPTDNPTGSTPDPTDPNQFRATLTGNTLTVTTQPGLVSFVVIRSDYSERHNEDYFYALSFDSVSCPITRGGTYEIHIGCWNYDFFGKIYVKSVIISDFNGKIFDPKTFNSNGLPGYYIIRLVTEKGTTSTKILRQP